MHALDSKHKKKPGPNFLARLEARYHSLRILNSTRVIFGLVASDFMSNRLKNGSLGASNDKVEVGARNKKCGGIFTEYTVFTLIYKGNPFINGFTSNKSIVPQRQMSFRLRAATPGRSYGTWGVRTRGRVASPEL